MEKSVSLVYISLWSQTPCVLMDVAHGRLFEELEPLLLCFRKKKEVYMFINKITTIFLEWNRKPPQ